MRESQAFFQVFLGSSKKEKTQLPADTTVVESNGEKKPGLEREHSNEKPASSGDEDDGAFVAGPTKTTTTDKYGVTEAEWETAQRAARTASWGAIFYLITTDILGPYSVPWAIAVRMDSCYLMYSRTNIPPATRLRTRYRNISSSSVS